MRSPSTADFVVPPDALQTICDELLACGVDRMPEDLSAEGIACEPANRLSLIYTLRGETRTVVWERGLWGEDEALPEQNNRFLRFYRFVEDYMTGTQMYKEMPPANGGYD